MYRNHIHFAPGLPKDNNVISGMRSNCEIYIYIDVNSALASGLKFYKSSNNVILSPGNSQGFIEVKYFYKVIDARTGKLWTQIVNLLGNTLEIAFGYNFFSGELIYWNKK